MKRPITMIAVFASGVAFAAKPFPDLTPQASDDFCDYLEWVFDSPLTQKQRDEAGQLISTLEGAKDIWAAELVMESVTARADLKNHSDQERATFRPSVEDELLKTVRSRIKTKPLARFIMNVKTQTTRVLAEGSAPLTQQALESWLELLSFVLKENGQSATPEEIQALRESTPLQFANQSDEQQQTLSTMPFAWSALRQSWPKKTLDEKRLLKSHWQEALVRPADAGKVSLSDKADALLKLLPGWL